jgi:hypothetical protein
MNNIEIEKYLKHHHLTKSAFKGVFARDQLQKQPTLKKGSFVIVNTDKRTSPGAHRVLIFRHHNGRVIYFDSYGHQPLYKEIYKFIMRENNEFYFNNWQLQDIASSTCGHYVLYFASQLVAGNNLERIRREHNFSKTNQKLNDKRIMSLFLKEFGRPPTYKNRRAPTMTSQCLCRHHGSR